METTYIECKISGTLSFILFISSIAGIAPLKFKRTCGGWRVKTSTAMNVYGRTLVVIISTLGILFVVSGILFQFLPVYSLLDELVEASSMMLVITVGLVGSFSSMKRMQHFVNYQAQITRITTELNKFHKQEKSEEWKIFVFVVCLLLFGNFILVVDYVLYNYNAINENINSEWLCLNVFIYLPLSIGQLIAVQYCVICISLLSSYRHINICLKRLHIILQDERSTTHESTSTSAMLNRISHLYCTLCDIVGTVTDTHGLLLVLIVLMLTTCTELSLHQIVFTMVHQNTDQLYSTYTDFWWVVFHFSSLVIIIEPCHRIYQETSVSKILASNLMHSTRPSQRAFFNELQLFYWQLMSNDATFCPLGMFTLNRSLIMAIVGLLISYLVILISL